MVVAWGGNRSYLRESRNLGIFYYQLGLVGLDAAVFERLIGTVLFKLFDWRLVFMQGVDEKTHKLAACAILLRYYKSTFIVDMKNSIHILLTHI